MKNKVDNLIFLSILFSLTTAMCLLVPHLIHEVVHYPPLGALLIGPCLGLLGSWIMVGVGLGLPILLLASMLSWGQLILLIHGEVAPHFAQKGLFTTLDTLISKL